MDLTMTEIGSNELRAGYTCPCGCTPSVDYAREGATVEDGCCCGNTFAFGPHASATLIPAAGFQSQATAVEAPWGEALEAAWLIGPSTHADDHGHDHGHDHHQDHEEAATSAVGGAIDPVCGMTVEPETARAKDLYTSHAGVEYFFCGRGCKLDFADDPAKYLDPAYTPSM